MLITLEFSLVPAAPMAFKDFINATAVIWGIPTTVKPTYWLLDMSS